MTYDKSRERSRDKLGAKLVKALKKAGLKKTSYTKDWQQVTVRLPAKTIELHIDDRALSDRGYYGLDKKHPAQLRVSSSGDRYRSGLHGTYKLKDGDLDDKKLAKVIARVTQHAEDYLAREKAKADENQIAFANFARAWKIMTAAGFKRTSSYSAKLPPVSAQDECDFRPTAKGLPNFHITVKGSGHVGAVEVGTGYRDMHTCDVTLVAEYAKTLHEHEVRLDQLEDRSAKLSGRRQQ